MTNSDAFGVVPICRALAFRVCGSPAHLLGAPVRPHRRNGLCGTPRSPKSWPAIYEPDNEGKRPPESLYGSLKMWAHLQRQGIEVARCTIERIMRANDWHGVTRARRAPRTTEPDPAAARAPDLVNRQWRVKAPNLPGGRRLHLRANDLRVRLHRVRHRCLRRADSRLGMLADARDRFVERALVTPPLPCAPGTRSTTPFIIVMPEHNILQYISVKHLCWKVDPVDWNSR